MKEKKKWRWPLIFLVIALTVYNILPSVFYYAQSLNAPVSEEQALKSIDAMRQRLDSLDQEAVDWLSSFCSLLQVSPQGIEVDREWPQVVSVRFSKQEEADLFRSAIPRAGSLISFVPSQLVLLPSEGREVSVLRRAAPRVPQEFFSFVPKRAEIKQSGDLGVLLPRTREDGLSTQYVEIILDRVAMMVAAAVGTSDSALLLQREHLSDEQLLQLAAEINELCAVSDGAIRKKLCARFLGRSEYFDRLSTLFSDFRDRIKLQKKGQETHSAMLEKREKALALAEVHLKKNRRYFSETEEPLSFDEAFNELRSLEGQKSLFDLRSKSPFFEAIELDWRQNSVVFVLRKEVRENRERFEQLLINEVARISRLSGEMFKSIPEGYFCSVHALQDFSSYLVLKLDRVAEQIQNNLVLFLKRFWKPTHPDLAHFPIVTQKEFGELSPLQKRLCLLVETPFDHPRSERGSFTVSIKGLDHLFPVEGRGAEELRELLHEDLAALSSLLRIFGFSEFSQGGVAERTEPFREYLAAFREEFVVLGSKKWAVVECSNWAQRILVQNRIETQIHEELLKAYDEWSAAQVSLNAHTKFDIPKPTKNAFFSNVALTFRKLLRGDEGRIIRWGLDLSGGKTVQIELRDQNGRRVESESDVKQGMRELSARVNKMGVSEVAVRQLGNTIVLDFPSSQALSAKELVASSSMSFHVVNETFSPMNSELSDVVQRFLQEVWNEAVVTNRRDAESINAIARRRLSSDSEGSRTLLEHGLRLATGEEGCSGEVSEECSKIVVFRGDHYSDWHYQTHPLLIVFNNYALQGPDLVNVHSSYDPSKGNYLSFDVRGSAQQRLYSWTVRFSKETLPQGWRMAVVLNDSCISCPALNSALRESAMISGAFSQREIQKLVSDLKAGSLTFTPFILSEKNVSPELGAADRCAGVVAMFVSLLFVVAAMVGYYRFAGVVASCAVFFNLLILWAALQNIQAALTLSGIAGIILTVAMAVDANVLVFERVKEEFAITNDLSMALDAGYKKAFSAIFDSNITTIIAALILLSFNAGPVKGFAVTLIIGMVSSLFTALFMTRTYFAKWVKKTSRKKLRMSHWIKTGSFDFLGKARYLFVVLGGITVLGAGFLVSHRSTIFGIDFSGGVSTNFEVEGSTNVDLDYVAAVSEAFVREGVSARDFQVRSLTPETNLRVLFSPSSSMVRDSSTEGMQKWMLHALNAHGLSLTKESLGKLDGMWTSMSGQMSGAMRMSAIVGLLFTFVSIFIYLMVRFETTFAAAALLCLLLEVLITLGGIGLLHAGGVGVQIDLNTIAALMTMIGYCLNDVIIIFDRIREELRRTRSRSLVEIVNYALNATLGRTAITSGITFFVLVILVVLGGPSLLGFSLVMAMGVLIGTVSSWFIASPLFLFFHKVSERRSLFERETRGIL